MRQHSLMIFLLTACATFSFAQGNSLHQPKLTPQKSGTNQLLIAVSPVNSRVVWAAGIGGTYVLTTDGGKTWRAGVVPGAEALQFRDVYGVSEQTAYLMSIGNYPGQFRIYKTVDGGATWNIEFKNKLNNAFYDCFSFWSPDRGITHSDSVNGVFPDIRTSDGLTWQSIAPNMPPALAGEASFAASGTCITSQGEDNAWIVTGGQSVTGARVLATTDGGNTWNAYTTPLLSSPSAGAISVAFRDALNGMVGGGDLSTNSSMATATSNDGGQTWTLTNTPPTPGSIFCLAYVRGKKHGDPRYERAVVVTAETEPAFDSGSAAWTPDEGQTWYALPNVSGYWAVGFADPKHGWFVGNNGQILKISF